MRPRKTKISLCCFNSLTAENYKTSPICKKNPLNLRRKLRCIVSILFPENIVILPRICSRFSRFNPSGHKTCFFLQVHEIFYCVIRQGKEPGNDLKTWSKYFVVSTQIPWFETMWFYKPGPNLPHRENGQFAYLVWKIVRS